MGINIRVILTSKLPSSPEQILLPENCSFRFLHSNTFKQFRWTQHFALIRKIPVHLGYILLRENLEFDMHQKVAKVPNLKFCSAICNFPFLHSNIFKQIRQIYIETSFDFSLPKFVTWRLKHV